jgi:Rieske 2Fe-2S family protein
MPPRARQNTIRLEPALPARYYRDPQVLDAEWERIFRRSWLYAGREERAARPGDFFTLPVGPESVLVVRDHDGRLRAFHNVCRHRGARLCAAETGSLRTIRCPYHAWTYALDGRLAAAPNLRDGDGFRREDFALHPVALETWRGGVFISLDERPEPLERALGGMPERVRRYPLEDLRIAKREVHEVEANWKILVENYQECYHCPGVHPELCDLVPLYGTGVVDDPDAQQTAVFRHGAVTFTHGGTTARPLFAGLTEQERRTYDGELILPAAWMNFLPDFVQTRALWPVGPTRTRLVTEWLFEASTMARPDFDPSDALAFTMLVSGQDWKVCEAVQRGAGSRVFREGLLTPLERAVAEFDRWILERLEGPAGAPRGPAGTGRGDPDC